MLKVIVVSSILVICASFIKCDYDKVYLKTHFEDVDSKVPKQELTKEVLEDVIRKLVLQSMDMQLRLQEQTKSSGHSGIKKVRHTTSGSSTYQSTSHVGKTVAGMHDHQNNIRTLGTGENIFVLNGNEGQARHNDYRIQMPSTTSGKLFAMEPIPLPNVPPEVLNIQDINGQIEEMRAWFKDFANQDKSTRDYTKYFKPVICYLEGYLMEESDQLLEAPWSDRHFKESETWFEMFETYRLMAQTGTMKASENIVFLPKIIQGLRNNRTIPILSQFDYRMLCYPIKRDIPFNRFKVVDELSVQVARKEELTDMPLNKAARFTLNPYDSDKWSDGFIRHGLLDEIMYDIPGLDNRPTNIRDDAFDCNRYELNNRKTLLDASRYHRWFGTNCGDRKVNQPTARFFNDDTCFVAFNTQEKISNWTLTMCTGRVGNKRDCKNQRYSVSFAFPFEVVFTTPLSNWNPFGIVFKGRDRNVRANGRNGGLTVDKAYNGSSETAYYMTPREFFTGGDVGSSEYSLSEGDRGVLDKDGKLRITRASGHYIIMPPIEGVGRVRQRWPIMPIYGEGDALWKEVDALKKILQKNFPQNFAEE